MVVIPRYTFNTAGSTALNERLKEDADGLAGGDRRRPPASPAAPPN